AQLARDAQLVQVERPDAIEDRAHVGRFHGFAALEPGAVTIDAGRARRDLLGRQLAHHVDHLLVKLLGLFRGLETVGRAIAVLGQLDQLGPVDAALEVEAEVGVVLKEVGHAFTSFGAPGPNHADGAETAKPWQCGPPRGRSAGGLRHRSRAPTATASRWRPRSRPSAGCAGRTPRRRPRRSGVPAPGRAGCSPTPHPAWA